MVDSVGRMCDSPNSALDRATALNRRSRPSHRPSSAAGVSRAGLGLGRSELGSGVRTGAAAAAVFTGAALPATRPFFLDKRAAAAEGRPGGQ